MVQPLLDANTPGKILAKIAGRQAARVDQRLCVPACKQNQAVPRMRERSHPQQGSSPIRREPVSRGPRVADIIGLAAILDFPAIGSRLGKRYRASETFARDGSAVRAVQQPDCRKTRTFLDGAARLGGKAPGKSSDAFGPFRIGLLQLIARPFLGPFDIATIIECEPVARWPRCH